MGNIPARGIAQTSKTALNITNFHTLTRERDFGGHHVGALAGLSAERFNDGDFTASNQGYLGNEITELNGGSSTPQVSGKSSQSRLASYFGRVNYDYRGKYLAEASFRYDGSSASRTAGAGVSSLPFRQDGASAKSNSSKATTPFPTLSYAVPGASWAIRTFRCSAM